MVRQRKTRSMSANACWRRFALARLARPCLSAGTSLFYQCPNVLAARRVVREAESYEVPNVNEVNNIEANVADQTQTKPDG